MRRFVAVLCVLSLAALASAQEYNVPFRPRAAAGGQTITFDAQSQGTEAAPSSSPVSVSHVGGASPEGVVVFCHANDTSADVVTGATYNGVAMTQIANENDTANELMFIEAYFLASPAAGTNTAECAYTGTQEMVISVITIDASGTPSVAGSCTLGENAANPSCTITGIAAESYGIGGLNSGLAATASVTPGSGFTIGNQTNIGGTGQSFHTEKQTNMQSSGDNTIAFTSATDDVALVGVAIQVP